MKKRQDIVCPECGESGDSLYWFTAIEVANGVQQNRLSTHDVRCVFVLGCECGATIKTTSVDSIAGLLNKDY